MKILCDEVRGRRLTRFWNGIGGGGIRTHGSGVSGEGETRSGDYKSPALDHSATPPQSKNAKESQRPDRGLGHKRDPLDAVSSLLRWERHFWRVDRSQHIHLSTSL